MAIVDEKHVISKLSFPNTLPKHLPGSALKVKSSSPSKWLLLPDHPKEDWSIPGPYSRQLLLYLYFYFFKSNIIISVIKMFKRPKHS
jgi:hypothetical protein